MEEVDVEHHGGLHEHLGVYAVLAKHAVDGGAVAVEFSGKPCDASFLAFKLFSDAFSYTDHRAVCGVRC